MSHTRFRSTGSTPSTPSTHNSDYSDDDISTAPTTPRHSKPISSDTEYLIARVKSLELELERSTKDMSDQVKQAVRLQMRVDELVTGREGEVRVVKEKLERRVKELERVLDGMRTKVGGFVRSRKERLRRASETGLSWTEGLGIVREEKDKDRYDDDNGDDDDEDDLVKMAMKRRIDESRKEAEDARIEMEKMKRERDEAERATQQHRDQHDSTVLAVQHYLQEASKEHPNSTDALSKSLETATTLINRLRNPTAISGRPNTVADLHARILTLEREKETASKDVIRVRQEHDRLVRGLKLEVDVAREEAAETGRRVAALTTEISAVSVELAGKDSEARIALSKVATLEAALENASVARDEAVVRARADRSKALAHHERQMEQLGLEGADAVLQSKVDTLTEENAELEKALGELQSEMTNVLAELQTWRERCEEAELTAKTEDVAEVEAKLDQVEEDRNLVRRKYEKLKIEYKSVVGHLREKQAENEVLLRAAEQEGNESIEAAMAELEEKAHVAEKERAEWELRAEVFKAQAKKATRDMDTAVEELHQRLGEAETTIASLKSQIDAAREEAASSAPAPVSLRSPPGSSPTSPTSTTFQQVELVTALQSAVAAHETTISSLRAQMIKIQRDYDKETSTLRATHESTLSHFSRLQVDHDAELTALRNQLETQLQSDTQKQRDISALQSARELNSLDARVKELELDLETAGDRYGEKIRLLEGQLRGEHSTRISLQQDLEDERRAWEDERSESNEQLRKVERRLRVLEDEVTRLMTKNMDLVVQLSERDR